MRNLRIGERRLDEVEPETESRMETLLRLKLTDSGLPRPIPQYEVRDAKDRFVARLDLAYPQQRVAVEYDGAWHWKQRREDDRRRGRARALGWWIIVVSADDLFKTPAALCQEVRDALQSRAA